MVSICSVSHEEAAIALVPMSSAVNIFAIDTNGILNASTQGKSGGVSNQITI